MAPNSSRKAFHEGRDGVDLAEIERPELKAAAALLDVADRFAQFVAFAPRHRDHIVAGRRQPSRDGKPDAAASSGHQDIMHRAAPAFRPR